jgi:hypothetical protein
MSNDSDFREPTSFRADLESLARAVDVPLASIAEAVVSELEYAYGLSWSEALRRVYDHHVAPRGLALARSIVSGSKK